MAGGSHPFSDELTNQWILNQSCKLVIKWNAVFNNLKAKWKLKQWNFHTERTERTERTGHCYVRSFYNRWNGIWIESWGFTSSLVYLFIFISSLNSSMIITPSCIIQRRHCIGVLHPFSVTFDSWIFAESTSASSDHVPLMFSTAQRIEYAWHNWRSKCWKTAKVCHLSST